MTLAIVRHGQSTFNLQNRFTGDIDVPLTLLGKYEAFLAGKQLRETGVTFQDAFSSRLLRSIQSLKAILEVVDPKKKVNTYQVKALNERSYGKLQGFSKTESEEIYTKEKVNEWRRDFNSRPPGGETLAETYQRVVAFYRMTVEPLLLANHNVLIVAHGNSLRALIKYIELISDEDISKTEIATGTPILYDIQEGSNHCLCYQRRQSRHLQQR
ncbi:MAG: 2,3-diphosphoglycerate-dependent phosphoglycerate mutase [Cyclobacteriaceae bacterium]|nr:2,3-diphosphoglycerate-dependent phosphoglycerate mutase [Cyclobacteriaceae bacterium]